MKPLTSTKMLLVLLLACTEMLVIAPKIITFLLYPPLGCEKLPLESNPIPYSRYLYLTISAFFVNLTAPNKQLRKEIPVLVELVISL